MKNLFDRVTAQHVQQRIAQLGPESERLWGKMNAAQMAAHCSVGLELALGDKRPPRVFLGRIIGRTIKRMVLRDEEPLRRNSPTVKIRASSVRHRTRSRINGGGTNLNTDNNCNNGGDYGDWAEDRCRTHLVDNR